MHRVGVHPADAAALARRVTRAPELRLAGVCTHFAVADEPDDPYTPSSWPGSPSVLEELGRLGVEPHPVHAANSAGRDRRSPRRASTSCGSASRSTASRRRRARPTSALRPALVVALGGLAREDGCDAGDRVSYGLRYELEADATIATVPIGYADGVPRNLAASRRRGRDPRARRCRIAGTVTMDQLMVDVGDLPVEVGDEVVLIGRDGRRDGHRGGMGRAPGHDRLRDRVRHRPARAAELPLMRVEAGGRRARHGAARARRCRVRRQPGRGAPLARAPRRHRRRARRSIPTTCGACRPRRRRDLRGQAGCRAADPAVARRDALGAHLGEADGGALRAPGSG